MPFYRQERSFRRLDPARFKNELADDVEQVPAFFGLCTKNETAPVVPGVGDDAMTEWDIVCRGLDTLRKEEIRAWSSVLPMLIPMPFR